MFAFHLDTRNAARIAPAGQRVLRVGGSFPVSQGDEVTLIVLAFPIPLPQRWRVRIAVIHQPTLIVDEAIAGPFAAWRHEHAFAALDARRTTLTDRIDYRLGFGAAGRLVDRLIVGRLLRRSFRDRQARTRALLEHPDQTA